MSVSANECLKIVAVGLAVSYTSSPRILNRRISRMFTFHLTNRTSVCTALSQCRAAFYASDVDVNGGKDPGGWWDLTNGTLMYVPAGYLVI